MTRRFHRRRPDAVNARGCVDDPISLSFHRAAGGTVFFSQDLKGSAADQAPVTMETALTSCTECGADFPRNQDLCPRCHRPRWYTLKKLSALLLIIGLLVALIKYLVVYGDRTLSQWLG
jgi:hypothetical protein